MIDWESVKTDFAWDGSWRDVYVLNCTINDWAAIWPRLRNSPDAKFFVDGQPQDAPIRIEEAFRLRESTSPMLHVKVGRMVVVFHFFSECEIECDLDPRDVEGQADLDALLSFVREIADLTCKRAIVTPENGSDVPFIEYDPRTGVMTHLAAPN